MLIEFEKELKDLLEKQNNARPFVCDGNPLQAKLFIVGINPATSMENSFWDFWSINHGFKKTDWLETYILNRKKQGKKTKLSPTRRNINNLVDALSTLKILETNLFSKATRREADLKEEDKDDSVFKFLLKNIKPKILLLHGNKVIEKIEKDYNIELKKDAFTEVKIFNQNINIYATKHLSKYSKKDTEKLVSLINSK